VHTENSTVEYEWVGVCGDRGELCCGLWQGDNTKAWQPVVFSASTTSVSDLASVQSSTAVLQSSPCLGTIIKSSNFNRKSACRAGQANSKRRKRDPATKASKLRRTTDSLCALYLWPTALA